MSHWTSWENENSHHNKNEYLALMILLHKPTILLYTKYIFFCVFHSPRSSLTFSFCFSGFTHLQWWWTKYVYMQQQKKKFVYESLGEKEGKKIIMKNFFVNENHELREKNMWSERKFVFGFFFSHSLRSINHFYFGGKWLLFDFFFLFFSHSQIPSSWNRPLWIWM